MARTVGKMEHVQTKQKTKAVCKKSAYAGKSTTNRDKAKQKRTAQF